MLYLVFFLFLLLVAIIITIFSSTIVLVEYKRQDWDDFLIVKLKAIWGIIRYEYIIPLMDIDKTGLRIEKVKERTYSYKKRKDERIDVNLKDIIDKIGFIWEVYNRNLEMICKIKGYLRKRLFLDEYKLEAEIGAGDAYYTALINGAAWTVAGIVSSFFLNNFKTSKKCILIKNDFNQRKLDIVFRCIFRTRFVHIIIVVFMVLAGIKSLNKNQNRSIGGGLVG